MSILCHMIDAHKVMLAGIIYHSLVGKHEHGLFACCSLSEPGLWDYVITNETMEGTGKQLSDIAGRALAGQIGNGIAELQDPDVSQALTNQTVRSLTYLQLTSKVSLLLLTGSTTCCKGKHTISFHKFPSCMLPSIASGLYSASRSHISRLPACCLA